jgi:flagella basal body P-ring formation protein FlgA
MIRQLLTISGAALLGLAAAPLAAQAVSAESLRQFVQREATAAVAAAGSAARVEVTVGSIDSRLQLAPCARSETFVPAGMRLWGRASVGQRCLEGAQWSVLVPVTVRVHGPALVATRPLAPHTALEAADTQVAEVEWTREPQGVATDTAQLHNRVLQRSVGLGQPIPLAALRAPTVISQGDPVRVIGNGRGFSISAEAIALASAQEGQAVRVRTDSGRVLSGTARAGRQVEVVF